MTTEQTAPTGAAFAQAIFEALAEVYIPDGPDTAAKPECSCHFVDIGIGTQKASEDPGCPLCTPHGYVEWLTVRVVNALAAVYPLVEAEVAHRTLMAFYERLGRAIESTESVVTDRKIRACQTTGLRAARLLAIEAADRARPVPSAVSPEATDAR